MSDLVKRLRDGVVKSDGENYHLCASEAMFEAADRIEQLERELRVYMDAAEGHMVERMRLTDELAAEKALADQADAIILKIINGPQVECIPDNEIQADIATYRKARGL